MSINEKTEVRVELVILYPGTGRVKIERKVSHGTVQKIMRLLMEDTKGRSGLPNTVG